MEYEDLKLNQRFKDEKQLQKEGYKKVRII